MHNRIGIQIKLTIFILIIIYKIKMFVLFASFFLDAETNFDFFFFVARSSSFKVIV